MLDTGKHQSGRTTRMLAAAAKAIKEGKRVIVIAADTKQIVLLDAQMRREHGIRTAEYKCTTAESCHFDWRERRCFADGLTYTYFIDHYAIECFFNRYIPLYYEMHKYDEPREMTPAL